MKPTSAARARVAGGRLEGKQAEDRGRSLGEPQGIGRAGWRCSGGRPVRRVMSFPSASEHAPGSQSGHRRRSGVSRLAKLGRPSAAEPGGLRGQTLVEARAALRRPAPRRFAGEALSCRRSRGRSSPPTWRATRMPALGSGAVTPPVLAAARGTGLLPSPSSAGHVAARAPATSLPGTSHGRPHQCRLLRAGIRRAWTESPPGVRGALRICHTPAKWRARSGVMPLPERPHTPRSARCLGKEASVALGSNR